MQICTQKSILIFKTAEEKFKKLKDLILKNHTYETPCVLKLPITEGHKKFLDWIEETLN